MPAKSLVLEKSARKNLIKLPLNIHKRIIKALKEIQENPNLGPKLRGELSGYRKFRLGDYRIVYEFNITKSRVEILKIEHRQGVYK